MTPRRRIRIKSRRRTRSVARHARCSGAHGRHPGLRGCIVQMDSGYDDMTCRGCHLLSQSNHVNARYPLSYAYSTLSQHHGASLTQTRFYQSPCLICSLCQTPLTLLRRPATQNTSRAATLWRMAMHRPIVQHRELSITIAHPRAYMCPVLAGHCWASRHCSSRARSASRPRIFLMDTTSSRAFHYSNSLDKKYRSHFTAKHRD